MLLLLMQSSLCQRCPIPAAGFLFSLRGNVNWLPPELARANGSIQLQSLPEGQSWARICGDLSSRLLQQLPLLLQPHTEAFKPEGRSRPASLIVS